MNRAQPHLLIGKWRIVETEDLEAGYINMLEPAYIAFEADGSGEFVFGCVTGGIDAGYGTRTADFTWQGNDEMDEASGSGSAELEDDGTLTGEISFHRGDDLAFKARRW